MFANRYPINTVVDLLGLACAGKSLAAEAELHGVFREALGPSVAQAILRRRAVKTAYLLLNGKQGLSEIADAALYRNKNELVSNFRQIVKMEPEAYRERGRLIQSRPGTTIESLYEVQIVKLPPRRVAAVRHFGDRGDGYRTFNRLYLLLAQQGFDFRQARRHTFFHDDPLALPAHAQSNDCCISVDHSVQPQGDLQVFNLPSGPHAVVRHMGPYVELGQAHFWLTRWWLPAQALQPRNSSFTCTYGNVPETTQIEECRTLVAVPLANLSETAWQAHVCQSWDDSKSFPTIASC